ncbi:MAG: TIGR04076 family protein [Bacteroidales bacterium]|nr:TIGR04076 family protein [Bacteroidales bacterium]
MKRRQFLCKSGCTIAGLAAVPVLNASKGYNQPQERRRYEIEIEIYEAREDTWCHNKGDKFKYPDDIGRICPWLLASMHDFIIALQHGATLAWKYEGTPYEKVIDPDGVTTEFVRCPDPTSDLVAKITRTLME